MRHAKIIFPIVLSMTLLGCNHEDEANLLQVKFTVSNLPSTLTVNKASTPDNQREYGWTITFDTSEGGVIGQGDLVLSLEHFKYPSATEKTIAVDEIVAALWEYSTDTSTQFKSLANVSILNSTITLSIDKSAHPTLEDINESTLVYFETAAFDAGLGHSRFDYYPSLRTYINMSNDKKFTDKEGDVQMPIIDLISMEIQF